MLTIIICGLLLGFWGKLLALGIRASWGLLKFVITICLLPAVIMLMAFGGAVVAALLLFVIVGVGLAVT